MSASGADVPAFLSASDDSSVEEQARRLGARPIKSVDELLCDVWESDEELDELLAHVRASRQAGLKGT